MTLRGREERRALGELLRFLNPPEGIESLKADS
jgi:hypothetical protein